MKIIKENLKFNGSFRDGENVPSRIVLHLAEAKQCSVHDIHRWHINNGWAGIGYHYLVRKDGTVYEGRKEGWRGSHCPSANYNSIGICFEGSFMTEVMGDKQLTSGIELIADIKRRYGNMEIYGHKELYATDCPGNNFPLHEFKSGVYHNNNVVNKIESTPEVSAEGGEFMRVYRNGSTSETVYADNAFAIKIGSLDAYEECRAMVVNNDIMVYYNCATGKKVGFVSWKGGLV